MGSDPAILQLSRSCAGQRDQPVGAVPRPRPMAERRRRHAATATPRRRPRRLQPAMSTPTRQSGPGQRLLNDFNTNGGIVDAATEEVAEPRPISSRVQLPPHLRQRVWDGDKLSGWRPTSGCAYRPGLRSQRYCVIDAGRPRRLPFAWNLRHVSLGTTVPACWPGPAMLQRRRLATMPAAPASSATCAILVRRHHDVRCNITVDDRTFDTDGDGMSDACGRGHDAVAIGVPDAGRPRRRPARQSPRMLGRTVPGIADVTTSTSALANAAFAIDSRIAGKDPAIALPLFENYLANGANGVFLRNTNCWAADLDLTCCSPWNSFSETTRKPVRSSARGMSSSRRTMHCRRAALVYFVDRRTTSSRGNSWRRDDPRLWPFNARL